MATRILLVEDNAGDTRLIREMFNENGAVQFELDCVACLSTGLERLAEVKFEAVLLDLGLPDSQGLETLKKVHTQAPGIPIVVLTGLADEMIATRAVQQGAQDYLVKGQVNQALLVRSIRYAIARQWADNELRESEERYRGLLEISPDAIALTGLDNKIITCNQQAAALHGRETVGEMFRKDILKLIAPEDRERARANMAKTLESGRLRNVEYTMLKEDGSTFPAELSTSLVVDAQGKPTFLVHVVRDITERKQGETERQENTEKLRQALGGTIQAVVSMVETRDPYTAGHQRRVTHLARALAQEMSLSRDQIDGVRMAGAIHDLGKISVPAEILSKPGRLTEHEFNIIKTHPQVGYDILKNIEFPWPVAQIVLQHHEMLNGSGYPQGLSGAEILLEARILGVADFVEALSSHRPYRPALGTAKALEELSQNKGLFYDPGVVDTCIKLFVEKGFAFEPERRIRCEAQT